MNKDAALMLLDRLSDATYLDRKSGVVQVIRKVDVIADGVKIEKRIPYSHSATYQECASMKNAMIPNSKYMSCLYFEDQGVSPLEKRRDFQNFQGRLRLVCWLNMLQIAGVYTEVNTTKIMGDIINRITQPDYANGYSLFRLKAEVTNIPPQDSSIFSNYDYDEAATQFLMPPYDFFAIDFGVKYAIKCDTQISEIITTENPCAQPITNPEGEPLTT